jgi:hypothetical protein
MHSELVLKQQRQVVEQVVEEALFVKIKMAKIYSHSRK